VRAGPLPIPWEIGIATSARYEAFRFDRRIDEHVVWDQHALLIEIESKCSENALTLRGQAFPLKCLGDDLIG